MIINRDCSVEGAFAGISLDSVSHRVTPHYDAGSSEGPQRASAAAGIPCPGIPGFRIKCGMTERVFPGFRVTPGHPAPDAGSIGGYFWIPRHTGSPRTTMRGPLAGIPGYRITPGHPAQRCGVQKSASCGYCLCRYFLGTAS